MSTSTTNRSTCRVRVIYNYSISTTTIIIYRIITTSSSTNNKSIS